MPKLLKIAIVIIIIALLLFSQGINPLFENHPHNKDPPIS